MKKEKLYNIFFPIWFLMFFPPIIFVTLAVNFLFDTLVIVVCFYALRLAGTQINLKTFYRKSILKVWILGFLADIIGASILFILEVTGDFVRLPAEITGGISFNPFSNFWAAVIVIFAMLISAVFIFIFNYKIIYKELVSEKKLRLKLAVTIAVVTMPWTFLIPSSLIYK